MEVKPIEIANICSIFINSRTLKINFNDLVFYARLSMLIDSENSPERIINYAHNIGILKRHENYVYATDVAKNLGKLQVRPTYYLNLKSQDYFLKNILFNLSFTWPDFLNVIQKFVPNQKYGTYIYIRTFQEDYCFLNWLKTLNSLSLTENLESIVLVRNEYLENFNQFLFKLKNNLIFESGLSKISKIE